MKRKVDPHWAKQLGLPPSSSGLYEYEPEPHQDPWRCGCDRCEYRVDFLTRDDAEEAARLHNNAMHRGRGLPTTFWNRLYWPYAKVYVADWLRRFLDDGKDGGY